MGNLIECPMCGKMISPKAAMCPNCGEPMKKKAESNTNEEQKEEHSNDKYSLILEEPGETPSYVLYKLIDLLGANIDTAKEMIKYNPYLLLDDLKLEEAQDYKSKLESVGAIVCIALDEENSSINYIENCYIEDDEINEHTEDVKLTKNIEYVENGGCNTIECPNCKSTNVKKIGSLSKAGSVALFGIFSIGKLTKTYECKQCEYRW